ncbi:hypothetical protein [Mucisphaera calidilacus]|uniref:Uncharacterized protein n=1 Tax=Mucisphaera calidilacus TaxID=2527982 RepID=A0A518BVZ0_9BACT|nr:hypothetical protein [Mucisphaera calidilacus]QDU71146.1 hypothetical protein Pan265_09950 [Mucisphaera calidilacus]
MNELPPAEMPRDEGRLVSAGLEAVQDYITNNYAWNATWLVVLLSLVSLALLVLLTRRFWQAQGDRVRAVLVFWQVCRSSGMSMSDTLSLWSATAGRPVGARLAVLLSRGALRQINDLALVQRASRCLFARQHA